MNFDDRSTPAGRFYGIASALCLAVGNAIRPGFIDAVWANLVNRRIGRIRGMLMQLEARFLAGLLVRRVAVAGAEPMESADRLPVVRASAEPRLPRRLGWLCPLVPSYEAIYAGHMRAVLAEPGMQELLAACPQAVRLLGPLCRMLGIAAVEYVPGAVEAAQERALRVRAPRARRVKVVVEDPRVAHYASTGVPRRFWFKVPGL
eukprot:gene18798-19108_t